MKDQQRCIYCGWEGIMAALIVDETPDGTKVVERACPNCYATQPHEKPA